MNNFNFQMRGQLFNELNQVNAKLKEAIAKDDAYEVKRLKGYKQNLERRLY